MFASNSRDQWFVAVIIIIGIRVRTRVVRWWRWKGIVVTIVMVAVDSNGGSCNDKMIYMSN